MPELIVQCLPVNQLEQHLLKQIEEPETDVIFPTSLSKDRFLERVLSKKNVVSGRNIYSLHEFVNRNLPKVASLKDYKQVSYYDQMLVIEELITEHKQDLPQLYYIVSSGATDQLVYLLGRIERQIDADFEKFVKEKNLSFENEIQTLRDLLDKKKLILRAALHSTFARHLRDTDFSERKFVFAPFATWTYQAGGILKGLAKHNLVELNLVADSQLSKEICQQLGLADITPEKGNKLQSALLIESGIEASAEIVSNWIKDGVEPENILLVDDDLQGSLSLLSTTIGQPIQGSRNLGSTDNAAAALLKNILAQIDNPERINQNLNEDYITPVEFQLGDNYLRLEQTDLESIVNSKNLDFDQQLNNFYQILFSHAVNLESLEVTDRNSFLWLDRFKQELAIKTDLDPIEIEKLTVTRVNYGKNGQLVLANYGDAPSFIATHVCCFLRPDRSDRAGAPSVASEELLEAFPQLYPENPHQRLKSLLSAGYEQLVFVIEPGTDNRFYVENIDKFLDKNKIKIPIRLKDYQADNVKKLKGELSRLSNPVGNGISVTDLSSFDVCPLGWFLDKQLTIDNHPLYARSSLRGTLLHEIFEALGPMKERNEPISLLKDKITNGELEIIDKVADLSKPDQHEKTLAGILNVIDALEPLYNKAISILTEIKLSSEIEIPEAGSMHLFGKADAIFEFEQGFLMVDYKANKPPDSKGQTQAKLYPSLLYYSADNPSQKPVLGFAYLGLESQKLMLFLNKDKDFNDDAWELLLPMREKLNGPTKELIWHQEEIQLETVLSSDCSLAKIFRPVALAYKQMIDFDPEHSIKLCNRDYCSHNLLNQTFR